IALDLPDDEISRKPQLRRLQRTLSSAMALRGSHSLRDCVEYTWLHVGGPFCYASAVELDNATAFLALLATLERESSEDLLGRLDEKLGDLYASSSPATLQLMTIHQAKGLEFDVVIIPGLHRSPKDKDKSLVALQEFRTARGTDSALMAAIPARGDAAPSIYSYLRAVDKERSSYEAQRVLYVAATRAKNRLHLLGRYRQDKGTGAISATSGTFLQMLLPAFAAHIGEPAESREEKKPAQSRPIALPLLQLVDSPPLPDLEPIETMAEPAQLRALPAREAAALGEALHQWLELIHDHWQQGWTAAWFEQHRPALASTLRRSGLAEERIPVLLPELSRMLVRAVSSETGLALAGPGGRAGSWAELVLYCREATGFSRHIIDRLYQDPNGNLVVLDYKSGEDTAESREKWIEQLGRYRHLVDRLDAGRVSRTLIYQATSNTVIDLSGET
ncbi:MAG TPA: 3'-5' exonuclease, partial [Xanthomonadales bacterium]|nr:3'-5' exonuclease [Xanthomonadales bacterium]